MATATKTKEYIRPIPLDWWLKKPAYTRFMIRDVTSIFIMLYSLFLLCIMERAEPGHTPPERWQAFYASWASSLGLVLHLIALAFAVYHSITFFNLTPRVVVVFRGEEKVPERAIAGGHYALWAVVSAILIVIVLVAT